MAGPVLAGDNPNKIKGGRWTVFRFFLVSTAYTSVWLAVSSQLGNYRELFGPQVLLQLNIAYFLPSIPLLIVSGLFDKRLEARFGVAKTVLIRLWVGLLGYGAICAWFPFQPVEIWYLLGSVVALGLFSGIAFSASYQLVSRFANKNVIALGLGCSASGPLVLLLQLLYGVGENPRKRDEILLYETIAVIVVAGLWATTSLLVRHWDKIEGYEQHEQQQAQLEEPLLGLQEGGDAPLSPLTPTSPPPGALALSTARHPSGMPPLIAYNSLEPYQTYITADDEFSGLGGSWSESSLLGAAAAEEDGGAGAAAARLPRHNSDPGSFTAPPGLVLRPGLAPPQRLGHARPSPPQQLAPRPAASAAGAAPQQQPQQQEGGGEQPAPGAKQLPEGEGEELQGPHRGLLAIRGRVSFNSLACNLETGSPHRLPPVTPKTPAARLLQGGGGGVSGDMRLLALEALRSIWPALCALGLSSTIALVIFPFFTYVPTSGLLGETLPKTLFFSRIFSDVLGRFLPRLRPLAVSNPAVVLVLAFAKLACVPVFFIYLKSPDRFHSDTFAVAFIALVWVLGGYINTMANVLAPRLVAPHLKATAAGLMAITYQTAHFVGLIIATVMAILMYGDIGVE